MKKLNIKLVMATFCGALFCVAGLAGCGKKEKVETSLEATNQTESADEKISVVASIFPEYDFLRQIGGDQISLKMLLTPGAESHSFEPTPNDMKEVIASDLFVYVGGDSDAWVESILDSVDTDKTTIITLMDCVETVEEEHVEGMAEEEEEGEEECVEYDEHVWTSPRNAMLICQKLCDTLCQIDPENQSIYQENTAAYLEKLDELDQQFKEVVANGTRNEIIVGDRFPFRYFVDAYGLTYYAAFPGCSTDTEANAATIAFLQDKVVTDKIPVVFHVELSNESVCNAICEQTGAKSELLNAVHNVTKDDFEKGVTYIDLMEHNVEVLKEALQ